MNGGFTKIDENQPVSVPQIFTFWLCIHFFFMSVAKLLTSYVNSFLKLHGFLEVYVFTCSEINCPCARMMNHYRNTCSDQCKCYQGQTHDYCNGIPNGSINCRGMLTYNLNFIQNLMLCVFFHSFKKLTNKKTN